MSKSKKIHSKLSTASSPKKRELPMSVEQEISPDRKKRKQTHQVMENPMGEPIEESEIDLDENIVGTGTFSKVYKGIYQDQTVAIKIFKQRVTDVDFSKEVLTLRNMKHDKIVRFIGYCNGEEKKIIMEFMERGTLFDLLHKELQEFTWLEKLKIIKQVTLAMKYLHSKNIAHCDLSSKNLLVNQALEIKISDFGQCERMDELSSSGVEFPNGRLRGTLRWMSKEILQKESDCLDKCDIWSFGVIMFEIGAGTIPYWNMTDADVKTEIKRGSWPVAKDFKIWMNSKISNKWKLLMDLCFQIPKYRPTFQVLDADILLMINSLENPHLSDRLIELRKM